MKKKYIAPLSFVLLATILVSCGQKTSKDTTVEAEKAELVRTQVIEKTTIARNLNITTTLEGYETQKISPSLTGRIEHIYVEVGNKVSKGADLIRMDQNQYNTANLTFQNLKTEFSRVESLRASGNISEQTYDQTKLQYDQAKESLEFLRTNTYIKAPFSGVISAKNYEDGELYSGSPILVLTQISTLKAFINVPESYFPLVKEGMKATVTSTIYPDETFPATVETVYPTIDASSHTFQVKLRIPNSRELLRPGMYANTYLALGEVQTVIVPYQSVLKLQGSNNRYVFLNDNGVAKRVDVTLGDRFDDQIEIISDGIKENDELVVVGQAKLVDGRKLSVQK